MIHQTLNKHFAYNQFREGQETVISGIIEGRSAAAIFPTGSGKSLCYQLPALLLPHLTLVISPLLALMQDQLDFLKAHNIPAACIDSTQSHEQSNAIRAAVQSGEIKILMISVERLKNERFRHFISQIPVSLLVVDEAHCISEWGHNFRPDYLKLPEYKQQLNIPQVLLLTATATPGVVADMQEKFTIGEQDVVCTGFYRQNLNLHVQPTRQVDKLAQLTGWLLPRATAASIVYVTLQKTAETLAAQLKQQGINASAYHAGLKSELREHIQQQFMQGQIHCIVATIAFGMGIDKSDIRNVIHYDLPKSIENYSQEIGRAGRNGQPSDCLVLANRDSLNVLQNFVYGDTPERHGIFLVLNEMQHALSTATTSGEYRWEFMLNPLSQQSNIRLLPLKTLLVQLELRGYIKPLYSYFAEYRFKYLMEEQQLINRFTGERREFVQAVVNGCKKARTWCTVDFDYLFNQYGADRNRVVTALEYFHAQGFLALESKQMTEVYQLTDQPVAADALADELYDYFRQKESSEINRIEKMINLFESDHCLSQQLAACFGDNSLTSTCGHCSVCAGQVATLPTSLQLAPLSGYDFQALCGELIQRDVSHISADLLARFLCGISVPIFTKLKARALPGFATLEAYPYADVKAWVNAHLNTG